MTAKERTKLIEDLFEEMRCQMGVMAEYGDNEDALREELETCDEEILTEYKELYLDEYEMHDNYYWIDTDYHYGDFNRKKFALIRGNLTKDGTKDRESEKVILSGAYDELNEDIDKVTWDDIDNFIRENLWYVPDYEVN